MGEPYRRVIMKRDDEMPVLGREDQLIDRDLASEKLTVW